MVKFQPIPWMRECEWGRECEWMRGREWVIYVVVNVKIL
jgi:hypothetical protein